MNRTAAQTRTVSRPRLDLPRAIEDMEEFELEAETLTSFRFDAALARVREDYSAGSDRLDD